MTGLNLWTPAVPFQSQEWQSVYFFRITYLKRYSESTKWNISQVKGSHLGDVKDGKLMFSFFLPHLADNFTCIEFDESGEYLAVGDKSGRITVFHGSAEVLTSSVDNLA